MIVLLLAALVSGCALPSLDGRSASRALSPEESRATALGRALRPEALRHPGLTGVSPLPDAHDAFASRVLLSMAAEKTLDVQYYIWHDDVTGMLLLRALYQAAERGVRVRLLLDDNGTAGLDDDLAALATHPNIEIRLFNPFVVRQPKWLGYAYDFSRLNRRMHNKAFIADNQALIAGGRNVGDEYFGASDGMLFNDLDVLLVGEVVDSASRDFDRYWGSRSAYPVARILAAPPENALAGFVAKAEALKASPAAEDYQRVIAASRFVTGLMEGTLELEWVPVEMVSDDPAKGLDEAEPEGLLIHQMEAALGAPGESLLLVSPYFVPTADGTDAFRALRRQGVTVKVLTNSLAATDVAAVHAGYQKRRKALLKAGVELYELRRLSPSKRNESAGPFGSSGSSLHAKTFAVDGERVFVGSFNFDPRSANLNTELGFLIHSEALASRIDAAFETVIPANAYAVKRDDDGDLYWLEPDQGGTVRHEREPATSVWRRGWVRFVSWLPVEWLL